MAIVRYRQTDTAVLPLWIVAFSQGQAGLYLNVIVLVVTVGVFAVLILLYAGKTLRYRDAVLAELRHPVKLNLFPTISISSAHGRTGRVRTDSLLQWPVSDPAAVDPGAPVPASGILAFLVGVLLSPGRHQHREPDDVRAEWCGCLRLDWWGTTRPADPARRTLDLFDRPCRRAPRHLRARMSGFVTMGSVTVTVIAHLEN